MNCSDDGKNWCPALIALQVAEQGPVLETDLCSMVTLMDAQREHHHVGLWSAAAGTRPRRPHNPDVLSDLLGWSSAWVESCLFESGKLPSGQEEPASVSCWTTAMGFAGCITAYLVAAWKVAACEGFLPRRWCS